jgi:hypothetical protein
MTSGDQEDHMEIEIWNPNPPIAGSFLLSVQVASHQDGYTCALQGVAPLPYVLQLEVWSFPPSAGWPGNMQYIEVYRGNDRVWTNPFVVHCETPERWSSSVRVFVLWTDGKSRRGLVVGEGALGWKYQTPIPMIHGGMRLQFLSDK